MVSARWAIKEATGVSSNSHVGASEVAGYGLQRRGRAAKLNGDDDAEGGNGNGTTEARDESERVRQIPHKSV